MKNRLRDGEAFDRLVEEHYDDVLAYCRRHAPSYDDAPDVAQEAFLRFVRSGRSPRDGKPLAYLFTKEQAVLMMADSVEAASRSLPEYTEESISTLVDKIIDTQVSEGYFKECPITFKDIATVKALFKEKLKTMYHTRISYPELKK